MRVIRSCLQYAIPLWVLAVLNLPASVAAEPQGRVLKAEGSGSLTSIAFSADGQWLAQTEFDLIRVWDLKAGKVVCSWKPPGERSLGLQSVTFSPDGKRLAVADPSYGCAILVYDPATGKLLWRKETRGASEIELSFSLDGKRLVSTGDFSENRGQKIVLNVFSAADGEWQRGFEGPRSLPLPEPVPIPFAPDGKTVAVVSGRGKVTLWDIESGKAGPEIHVDTTSHRISALAFSPDGKVLAVGTTKSVFLWDLAGEKPLRVLSERTSQVLGWHQGEALLIQFSADGASVFAFLDGKLQAWDAKTGEARAAPDVVWSSASAFSADRKAVASGFKVYPIPGR